MAVENSTLLILIKGEEKMITVQTEGSDLSYTEFFDMIAMLLTKSGYSQHEIESYILQWAEEIRYAREN